MMKETKISVVSCFIIIAGVTTATAYNFGKQNGEYKKENERIVMLKRLVEQARFDHKACPKAKIKIVDELGTINNYGVSICGTKVWYNCDNTRCKTVESSCEFTWRLNRKREKDFSCGQK